MLIKDFNLPSVLWGIDGDWQTNYIPSDTPFYPTDHCGVLRVKTKDIHPRYLSYLFEKAGKVKNFSRTLRASIDRIKKLTITIPSYTEQENTVSKVFKLESKIVQLSKELHELETRQQKILKKYL